MIEKDLRKISKSINNKSIFIFDFDGVLADSVNIKTLAFRELYKEYGDSVLSKVVEHHNANGGMSRFEKFKYYHQNFLKIDLNEEDIEELSNKFSGLVIESVIRCSEIRGAEEYLKKSYRNNKLLFVNSATPEPEIREIIKRRRMNAYFTGVFGSPKSKLDNLRVILSDYNIEVDQIVFFGDALSDYDAANSLGCMFVGIGKDIEKILSSHSSLPKQPLYLLEDFKEIL